MPEAFKTLVICRIQNNATNTRVHFFKKVPHAYLCLGSYILMEIRTGIPILQGKTVFKN
jgi:hypothetical protein